MRRMLFGLLTVLSVGMFWLPPSGAYATAPADIIPGPTCDAVSIGDVELYDVSPEQLMALAEALMAPPCAEVPGNRERIVDLLEAAARQGDPQAAFVLGGLYETGQLVGPSLYIAEQFYRLAAETGHTQAQHHLGMNLLGDEQSAAEIEEGLYWLGAAANQGDGFSAAVIGLLHARGLHGVAKDTCLALAWYEASELLGSPMDLEKLRREAYETASEPC